MEKNRMMVFGMIFSAVLFSVIGCGGPPKYDPGDNARIHGSRALVDFNEGNLQGALAGYRRAYVAAAKADQPVLQARYLFNSGRVYFELGVLDSADAAFQAAHREFTFYRDDAASRTTAGFVALVFARRGQYDEAFTWYERGRPASLKDPETAAFWFTVQAVVGMVKNRSPEALAYLDQAMYRYKKKKNSNGMAQVEYYRASIAFSRANYAEAREHCALSLGYLEGVPERYRRWRVLLASAATAFCMNDRDAGERYYKRALDCAPGGITLPGPDAITGCPQSFWEGNR